MAGVGMDKRDVVWSCPMLRFTKELLTTYDQINEY